MSHRASIAAICYFAMAAFLFAVAFTASSFPGAGHRIALTQEESVQVELSREAAAKRVAQTIKRSSPVFTATAKDSAS